MWLNPIVNVPERFGQVLVCVEVADIAGRFEFSQGYVEQGEVPRELHSAVAKLDKYVVVESLNSHLCPVCVADAVAEVEAAVANVSEVRQEQDDAEGDCSPFRDRLDMALVDCGERVCRKEQVECDYGEYRSDFIEKVHLLSSVKGAWSLMNITNYL